MSSAQTIPSEVFKQVRAIEIRTRKLVNDIFMGQYSSVFKGMGMEFAQVREYQPGDDPKLIDWNVTARAGSIFTKEFLEERELTVMVMVDASRSLFFGSKRSLKSETAAELAALLALSAIRNNDKVGLLIFTDKVEKYVPPRKGSGTILRLVREILTFKPEGKGTDLSSGLEFAARVLKRRSVCFLISDFLTEKDYQAPLKILARKNDVIAVRVSDALENQIPAPGRYRLRDQETGQMQTLKVSGADIKKIHFKVAEHFDQWKKSINRAKVDVIEVLAGEPYAKQFLSFFRTRAKRFR